jgi:energy-coupling factor transport system substrate-specific component
MNQIFISYSRKDIEFVSRLASDLERAGLIVWWDISGIPPGSEWPKRIQDGLEKSSHCVVVLSPDSIQSPWVRKEYTFAQSDGKQIIPLYYRPCKVPIALTDLNYIDITSNYTDGLKKLCNAFGVRFQSEQETIRRQADIDRLEREKEVEEEKKKRQLILAAEAARREAEARTKRAADEFSFKQAREKANNEEIEKHSSAAHKEKSPWKFGARDVAYSAIGVVLYMAISLVTYWIQLPSIGNFSFRPAVVIPMFFGVVFGPSVGFIAGFLGNIIRDLIAGTGQWFWWDLGNGIIGLIPGLIAVRMLNYKAIKDIVWAEVFSVIGILVGMGLASVSEMWVSGADFNKVVFANFIPAVVQSATTGLILLPILMIAYARVVQRYKH